MELCIKKKRKLKPHILSHYAQPYSDAMPELSTPDTYNVGPTREKQLCGPRLLELKEEEAEHQKNEINHAISYFQNTLSCDAAFLGSTGIPMSQKAKGRKKS